MLEILDMHELARELKMSYSKAQELARAGKLPGIKVGGRWKFRKQDIEAMFSVPVKKEGEDNV